ncbi:MAG: tryptophan synthase subunit alpha [Magnetococcales bacterium]|nr:tryptophan synthase subunit alpha [Magnetococcales bacterium]
MTRSSPPPAGDTLEDRLRQRLAERRATGGAPILLMSHLVLGYPSLAENRRVIDAMVAAGVDLIELQIPFSEPIADGPVIARANQRALDQGLRVADCLDFIGTVSREHAIPILIMTYLNILLARGVERFVAEAAGLGVRGLIVPDLPLEESAGAMAACRERGLAWVQLLTPTTPDARLRALGATASGFCYCVARKGVTGKTTRFDSHLDQFLQRCRQATTTPLALGFGVKEAADVAALVDKVEIAVVGTAAIDIHEREGVAGVGRFFAGLRR